MLKRLATLACAGALSLALLAFGAVINDRGGFLSNDILSTGREYLPLRSPARAAQGTGCMPTTGTVSGLTFAQDVNAAIAALISSNSGSSAPATDCSAVAVKGQVWLDTSLTPNVLKQFDGTAWVLLGALDSANHLWSPPIGGGTASVASAGTADIWASPATSITISGTTTITALANADAVPGTVKVVTMSGALTLTNGTAIELPSGANITTAAGDKFLVIAKTSTNVAVFGYTRADGSSLVNPSVPLGTIIYGTYGTAPAKTVLAYGQALPRASYPGFLAAVTRAQSATFTSGSATITGVAAGGTAGLGAGMPLEGAKIQAGTVIVSVTSSTIVMSKTATGNGADTVTAFLTGYGSGGDTTTVGVAPCAGNKVAGRTDASGTDNGLLTSATAINSAIGGKTQVVGLTHLPNVNFSVSVSPPSGLVPYNGLWNTWANVGLGTGGFAPVATGAGLFTPTLTGTAASGGSGTALPIVDPTLVVECAQVVLP